MKHILEIMRQENCVLEQSYINQDRLNQIKTEIEL